MKDKSRSKIKKRSLAYYLYQDRIRKNTGVVGWEFRWKKERKPKGESLNLTQDSQL